MPGITLKNIPDPLYHQLVKMAETHHRSLTKEIVVALEQYVQTGGQDKTDLLNQIRQVRNKYPRAITDKEIQVWKNQGRP